MPAPATAPRKKPAKKSGKPRLPKLHRPRKESTKTITTRLYKAWAQVVHALNDGHCVVCGKEHSADAPLNAHHVMPRQNFSGLRFDPLNGVSLCPRCHKMGKFSAHKGGIWFAEWLRQHRPHQYAYCLEHALDELDCKDRAKLYAAERLMRNRHGGTVEPIGNYRVVAYDVKGNKVEAVIEAYNNRAAEYVFWQNWPAGQDGYEKLKGIHKTTEVAPVGPEKVAEMKSDLIGRGLMDEDGNAINVRQLPKSTDAAAIAVVQTHDK